MTIGRCVSDIMQGGVQAGVGCTQGVAGGLVESARRVI